MTQIEPSAPQSLLDIDQRAREHMDVYVRVVRTMEDLTQAILRELDEPALASNIPFVVLFGLHLDGPLRPTAIARLTGLSSGGVSGVLERMEERGLLVRDFGSVAGDRRGVVVRLTDKGQADALAIADLLDGVVERLFRDLARAIELRGRRGATMPVEDPAVNAAYAPPETRLRARENLDLCVRLASIGEAIGHESRSRFGAAEYSQNLSLVTLYGLLVHGSLRPSEIQAMTGLSSGGVSGLLERLENLGIVTRDFGMVPGDRRGVTVRLTDTGYRNMLEVVEMRIEPVEQLLAEFATVIEARVRRRTAEPTD